MTNETSTQNSTPKKTSIIKKIFLVVGFILALLGVDYLTYNFAGIGAEVTLTDSTLVVTPSVDSIVASTPIVGDTTKADTTK